MKDDLAEIILIFFACSQGAKVCLLSFGQSSYACDLHPLVRSLDNECFETGVGLCIPELNRTVIAIAGQERSRRTEIYPPDPVGMASQCGETLAGRALPDADGLIVASACQ